MIVKYCGWIKVGPLADDIATKVKYRKRTVELAGSA